MAVRKKRSIKNILLIIPVVILAVLLLVYLAGAFFFSGHFLPHTEINETDVSYMTEEEAEEALTEEAEKYSIIVSGRENTGGIIAAFDIKLKPVFNGVIGEFLKSQNAFSWPFSYADSPVFTSENVVDFDVDRLNAALAALGIYDEQRPPKDAYLSDYSSENGYTVIPEDPGTTLIKEKTEEAVRMAVEHLTREIKLDEAGCYTEPDVFEDDARLNTLKDNLNKYVKTSLTIDYGDNSETVDGNLIGQWITVEGTTVTLDETKVREYVDGLSKAHDTFGLNRQFTTHDGETITVKGGNYGWWTDRPSTAAALTEAIKNGERGEFMPVYFSEAKVHGDSDIGNNYVEVDLDDQHVYVYKDNKLVVDSDCVSGKVSAGNFTPDGTYAITYKERDATLVGETYSSPVKFWMPFNGNIGMHDASWRSQFGGDIYVTGGSHGCVNLPRKKAEEIFDVIEKGEAVVVYGGKQEVPPADPNDLSNLTEEQRQALMQLLLQQQAESTEPQAGEAQQPEPQPEPQQQEPQPEQAEGGE